MVVSVPGPHVGRLVPLAHDQGPGVLGGLHENRSIAVAVRQNVEDRARGLAAGEEGADLRVLLLGIAVVGELLLLEVDAVGEEVAAREPSCFVRV
jgi:hypothetical protein